MGNWAIVIEGSGAHHNKTNETDANLMADAFVHELQAAGHLVSHASFTFGAKENLLAEDKDLTHPCCRS